MQEARWSSPVNGADQFTDPFFSASLLAQDVPLRAVEHVVEKLGDVPVTATVLTHTHASKDSCALSARSDYRKQGGLTEWRSR